MIDRGHLIFTFQLHGFEVDPVNSVQFSNHSAYKHMKGEKLHDRDLSELYEGLKLNDINKYSHILTGYCANSSFLLKIADIVKDIRRENPKVLFVCDPVLGDNGEYYTPKELMPIYRDLLIPMANVITPNIFELSELAGQAVSNEAECLEAIEKMHKKGVSMVVVTSGLGTGSVRHCYASTVSAPDQSPLQYRFDFPELPGMYVGTGDVFSSLLIVWLDKLGGDLRSAVEKVIASLQELLKLTGLKAFGLDPSRSKDATVKDLELQLVQSRVHLLCPSMTISSTKL